MNIEPANTISEIDMALQEIKNPQGKIVYVRDELTRQIRNSKSKNRANLCLYLLWCALNILDTHGEPIFRLPLENGLTHEKFRDWVDYEIGATFEKSKVSTPPTPSFIQDCVRIVERTLVYARQNAEAQKPVKGTNRKIINPKYLIEDFGFGKLKHTSSHFKKTDRTPYRDEILFDITEKTMDELKELYSESRILPIPVIEAVHPNGIDIFMFGLDDKQIGAIRNALQKLPVQQYDIQLPLTAREAILGELSFEAQDQEESDSED